MTCGTRKQRETTKKQRCGRYESAQGNTDRARDYLIGWKFKHLINLTP
jgi:hypothetical protein